MLQFKFPSNRDLVRQYFNQSNDITVIKSCEFVTGLTYLQKRVIEKIVIKKENIYVKRCVVWGSSSECH